MYELAENFRCIPSVCTHNHGVLRNMSDYSSALIIYPVGVLDVIVPCPRLKRSSNLIFRTDDIPRNMGELYLAAAFHHVRAKAHVFTGTLAYMKHV